MELCRLLLLLHAISKTIIAFRLLVVVGKLHVAPLRLIGEQHRVCDCVVSFISYLVTKESGKIDTYLLLRSFLAAVWVRAWKLFFITCLGA